MPEEGHIIFSHSDDVSGPLLIAIGAIHGNEKAGVMALERLSALIKNEKEENPEFYISGTLIGLVGNRIAYEKGERYLETDLNRAWTTQNVERIYAQIGNLSIEEIELLEISSLIESIVEKHSSKEFYLIDLHTTSSKGGIFTIPTENERSLDLALQLNAPVILGMLTDVRGTVMHYYSQKYQDTPLCISLAFEAGQHDDDLSPLRCVGALVNIMQYIGMIQPEFVQNKHNAILESFTHDLPDLLKLTYKHHVENIGNFVMNPGYTSFQKIEKGEYLATDGEEKIYAKTSGRILMPLYQKLGEDGFFIISEMNI